MFPFLRWTGLSRSPCVSSGTGSVITTEMLAVASLQYSWMSRLTSGHCGANVGSQNSLLHFPLANSNGEFANASDLAIILNAIGSASKFISSEIRRAALGDIFDSATSFCARILN